MPEPNPKEFCAQEKGGTEGDEENCVPPHRSSLRLV